MVEDSDTQTHQIIANACVDRLSLYRAKLLPILWKCNLAGAATLPVTAHDMLDNIVGVHLTAHQKSQLAVKIKNALGTRDEPSSVGTAVSYYWGDVDDLKADFGPHWKDEWSRVHQIHTYALEKLRDDKPYDLRLLPAELHHLIYQDLLLEETDIAISDALRRPALLQVCKQIRREAGQVYYGGNTFRCQLTRKDNTTFYRWLQQMYRWGGEEVRLLLLDASPLDPAEKEDDWGWDTLDRRGRANALYATLLNEVHKIVYQLARSNIRPAAIRWFKPWMPLTPAQLALIGEDDREPYYHFVVHIVQGETFRRCFLRPLLKAYKLLDTAAFDTDIDKAVEVYVPGDMVAQNVEYAHSLARRMEYQCIREYESRFFATIESGVAALWVQGVRPAASDIRHPYVAVSVQSQSQSLELPMLAFDAGGREISLRRRRQNSSRVVWQSSKEDWGNSGEREGGG